MSSSFTRLYRYAKAVGAEAKENFTTEALRASILSDGKPFLLALHRRGFVDDLDVRLGVEAQVRVPGAGQIDLVVTPSASRRPFWFEIKVDAGEHGSQLANYEASIASLPEPRPQLIVLGPTSLRPGLAWLSWQELRAAIVDARSASPYWSDFKTYLEEIRMADSYDERVTQPEGQALEPARKLLGKVARIVTPFTRELSTVWPTSSWPTTEDKVLSAMATSFVARGTLSLSNATNLVANLSVGLYHEPLSEDAWLGLWIWCRPNRIHARRKLTEVVALKTWDADWFRDDAEWELFGAYKRLTEFSSHAAATDWLTAKLHQLRDNGVLDRLPTLTAEG